MDNCRLHCLNERSRSSLFGASARRSHAIPDIENKSTIKHQPFFK
ncbi:hypothetical protein X949_5849 [Burkholderia pseudomallei MSHR5609]|nr:hypothetical protein X949_5849 [Burkholderia pseudomallei MSHR5609]KGX50667.1 hypothetical protein Y024_5872 [Burkholderia pseudomallei TSV44]